jgi:tRNA threonylcarbamoyl adenosine modification protein TsaD
MVAATNFECLLFVIVSMKHLANHISPRRNQQIFAASAHFLTIAVVMVVFAAARSSAFHQIAPIQTTIHSATFGRRRCHAYLSVRLSQYSSCTAWSTKVAASQPLKSSASSVPSTTSSDKVLSAKDLRYLEARAKRKQKYIGMAKAVDHGQPGLTTYQPFQIDTGSFVAKSGLPDKTKQQFTVLGIESSCDDTGAAVVRSDGVILGESLASQDDIHEAWGGVVPNLAREAHILQIDHVVQEALERAKMTLDEIDAIGVTVGPGLEVCLRVGCNKARELAMQHQKPFVAIHHLEAHILMARMPFDNNNTQIQNQQQTHAPRAINFPFLALLVSGGHCQLLKCLGIGQYAVLGGTIDDSLGEAYDKTARLLGLPVGGGGGPAIEKLAKEGNAKALTLTIPLRQRHDCDFSFAGLKTGVRVAAEKLCQERGVDAVVNLTRQDKADIAASFQNVAIKHIEQKLEKAMTLLEQEDNVRSLAVVGGVAANAELRSRLEAICTKRSWSMFVPPPRLCTDQGSMSAWAAIERLSVGSSDDPTNQEVYARFPFSTITQ